MPVLIWCAACGVVAGCSAAAQFAGESSLAPPVGNTVFVYAADQEFVWERVVDVLHEYRFPIAREDKLDGVIETEYKVGSGLLEPWHHDSVGSENRLESTLQSIRRRAFVRVTPSDGGHLVAIEVFKELEDVTGLVANSAGGATFQENRPLQRDLNLVVGQSAPSGWIAQGRDLDLECELVSRIHQDISL